MKTFFIYLKKAVTNREIRKRILFTLFCAVIYRFGTYILLPWLDPLIVIKSIQNSKTDNLWDRLLGTSFDSYSLFSLGVSPYISASIVVQLAGFSVPYFQRLRQEGAAGRARLNQISRQLTIFLAIAQATRQVLNVDVKSIVGVPQHSIYWFYAISVLLMTASTMFCVWLADRISEKGIGNGTSVLIMVGLLSRLPAALKDEVTNINQTKLALIIEGVALLLIIIAILTFKQATRRIPIQYARQMMVSPQAYQYLPIKMDIAGVMPIIFSSVFVAAVKFIASLFKERFEIAEAIEEGLKDSLQWQFTLFQAILIFFGTFMYAAISINPVQISDDIRQSNGFISPHKPGKETARYISTVISRIIFPASSFLAIITVIPSIVASETIGVHKSFCHFYGGSIMLILVGSIIDIIEQIEGYLQMSYYDDMVHNVELPPRITK